jgi:hypothetical protein
MFILLTVFGCLIFLQVGPSATKFFFEFLMRLLIRCTPDSLEHLYELMLKLVYTLTAERYIKIINFQRSMCRLILLFLFTFQRSMCMTKFIIFIYLSAVNV